MKYKENCLSNKDYRKLRESVCWPSGSKAQTKKALEHSLYSVTAVEDHKTVGMGRLTSDGLYYIVADVVVDPAYQRKGIGRRIIYMLLDYVEKQTPAGEYSSVQFIAEKKKCMFKSP